VLGFNRTGSRQEAIVKVVEEMLQAKAVPECAQRFPESQGPAATVELLE
jgi:hypothetical protein